MGARRYEVTRSIDATPETVWHLLTDASGFTRWNKAVLEFEGSIRPGEKIRLVSIADPKRTFKLTVADMQAPHHMVWADGMPFGLFAGRRTFSIAPDGAEGCTFTMVEEFTGPLAGLITKAIPDLTESFDLFADSLADAAG